MVFYNDGLGSMGIRVSSADRKPCPVCGHPTGDCAGTSVAPSQIAGFKVNEDPKQIKSFQLQEDIYERREIVPGVMTKFMVHPKGKFISIEEAEKLGLL